jgi:predicted DNA-binding ribbon-helix-helix protein
MMIRTQIQFTKEQWDALKKIAASRHVSISEVVRQSVDALIRSPENQGIDEYQRLSVEIVGKYQSGFSDISAEHDKYLSEIYNP